MTDDRSRDEEDPQRLSLEERRRTTGRLPGDRYVRIVRPFEDFRRSRGHYVATEEVIRPRGRLGRLHAFVRRTLFGRPLETEGEGEQRVSTFTGLAVLAPSNVSSSAYATEEAMRVIALAGVGALALTLPISLAVVAVLAIVVISELRVIGLYPGGGGAYVVARDQLGTLPALVAAAALMIDYVLTVAVSTAAGVTAISSFVPEIHADRAAVVVALIALLTIGHLRGLRDAGLIFVVPAYAYILVMGALVAYGVTRVAGGDVPPAVAPRGAADVAGLEPLAALLVVRALAAGAVAVTGTEAVSGVVPNFKEPRVRTARTTLLAMVAILATLFVGLSFLATALGIVPDAAEVESVNSMIARSILGDGSPAYLAVQLTTAIFLLVAANTGFSGFPRFASVLANDRFMPRQFAFQGERLAFSVGIVAVAILASVVVVLFDGSVAGLVPLYVTAVFLAFAISQAGQVRRWWRDRGPLWPAGMLMNLVGLAAIGTIVVVTAVTRFADGAWLVLLVVPPLVAMMYGIRRHYLRVADALVVEDLSAPLPPPVPPAVIVPVARLDRAAVQAIAFARAISPDVRAVHIATSDETAAAFKARWERWAGRVPLDVIESPYRSLIRPLVRYIERIDEKDERPITVVLAEFVPQRWWEWFLHSQTVLRLKLALLFRPNTIVIDVPYHFRDTADVAGARRSDATGRLRRH